MHGEDIFMGFLTFLLIVCFLILVVFLPLDAYFDSGAKTACRLEGHDGGYKTGIVFGEDICYNTLQEEEIEYFRLE